MIRHTLGHTRAIAATLIGAAGLAFLLLTATAFAHGEGGPPPAFTERVAAARTAAKAGRFADAKREYEAALRVVPTDLDVMTEYASILEKAGEPAAAARMYDKALEMERSHSAEIQANLLHGLGRAEKVQGHSDKAREHLAASLALRENAEVRVALNQLGGAPAPSGAPAGKSPSILANTAGLATEGEVNVPTADARPLDGPFASLDALCTAMVAKGILKGSMRCDPLARDYLGRQTPLGYPIFEAQYFAPSREVGSPFLIALRLTNGWWGMAAQQTYQGTSHDYELQTISSIVRQDPIGALVALRIRHRAWRDSGSPDALDSRDLDELLVCGMGESEKPGCVPQRPLGPPKRNTVILTESGVVRAETDKGIDAFIPLFP